MPRTKKAKASPAKKAPSKKTAPVSIGEEFETETVDVETLRPHPRNYKKHPEAQLEHIAESLREYGVYRNIVVAKDGTILAGHGVAEAARKRGLKSLPVRRLDLDPTDPRALKLVALDNELGRFAEADDRMLTELLKEVHDEVGLLGTGYDEKMLAALVMVTRPEAEIRDFDAAAEWVGMPEYDASVAKQFILGVQCRSEKDREEAVAKLGMKYYEKRKHGEVWTGRYPDADKNDISSIEWQSADGKPDGDAKKKNGARRSNGKETTP